MDSFDLSCENKICTLYSTRATETKEGIFDETGVVRRDHSGLFSCTNTAPYTFKLK